MYFSSCLVLLGLVSSGVTAASTLRVPLHSQHQRSQFNKRESIYNANGREYMIEISVGTPGQSFNLTMDTGSSELWIPSTSCPASVCPYSRFNQASSSSFKPSSIPFSIQYGQGSAMGVYGYDTVTIGQQAVNQQMIGLANNTKDILGQVTNGEQSNGIFGLGFPGLNEVRGVKNDLPFVYNLVQQKIISEPVFSIFLNSIYANGPSGEILFGGIDNTKFNGALQYVPVVNYKVSNMITPNLGSGSKSSSGSTYLYWTVAGQAVTSSTGFNISFPQMQPFVLDTGTTLTYMPAQIVKGLVAKLPGNITYDAFNMLYNIDCASSNDKKTTVNFQISTSTSATVPTPVTIAVPLSEMVMPLDSNSVSTATQCMLAIAPMMATSTSSPTWILGESTLRSIYQVYDVQNNRVGLAPASANGNGTVASNSSSSSGASPGQAGTQVHSGASSVNFLVNPCWLVILGLVFYL
ncbi:acid protease [Hesseltinella vesiculosa]|uniref:Acid protease n=1 Tax=Hesseltinella vesiculosa TaxID=101127 RepID=A0A1X2GPI0_9FUNG|nr:acid protease [Hesseltinella vesiculosa]